MREYEIVLCEIKFYEAAAPIEILKQIRKLCDFWTRAIALGSAHFQSGRAIFAVQNPKNAALRIKFKGDLFCDVKFKGELFAI